MTTRATVFPPLIRYRAPLGEVPASSAPPGSDLSANTWGSVTRANFARRVAGIVDRDFDDPALRTRADKPFLPGSILRLQSPEQFSHRGSGEIRERWTRDDAAVRACGESLEIATGDIASKIDLQALGQRIGSDQDGRQRCASQGREGQKAADDVHIVD